MSTEDYYEALNRLISGRPRRVPVGTKISNDSVALEAGKSRGAIKRSRSSHAVLIEKISEAKGLANSAINQDVRKLNSQKQKTLSYRQLYEESLNDRLMLMQKVFRLENDQN